MAQATPCPDLDRVTRHPGGWRWHALGEAGAAALENYLRTGEETREDRGHRGTALAGDGELFVKRFRMRDSSEIARETLRAGKFVVKGAWVEAAGALRLLERTGRGAQLYALGERRRLGLVVEQVLVFEALDEHATLGERLTAAPVEERMGLVERAGRLLLELDAVSLVHLDVNYRNVMLHATDPARDCLIDAELVLVIEPRTPELLAFVFGYLCQHHLVQFVPRREYRRLAHRLLAEGLGVGELSPEVRQACEYFMWNMLQRRQRVRLARRGLAGLPAIQRVVQDATCARG